MSQKYYDLLLTAADHKKKQEEDFETHFQDSMIKLKLTIPATYT